MIVTLSKEQFDELLKEALDGMNDKEYVKLIQRIADDAKLRGLKVHLDIKVNLKGRRSRNE